MRQQCLRAKDLERAVQMKEVEMALGSMTVPASIDILQEDDVWICDTGASSHSSKSKKGARSVKDTNSTSVGHAGPAVKATSTIEVPGRFLEKDGSPGMKAVLTEVSYNKGLNFNLFSLTRMLVNGWTVTSGDANGITIRKGENVINFDIVIPTSRGAIFACRFLRDSDILAASTESGVCMSVQKAHGLLGHGDENSTRQSAKELGWVITPGKLKPCDHCAKSNRRQAEECDAEKQ